MNNEKLQKKLQEFRQFPERCCCITVIDSDRAIRTIPLLNEETVVGKEGDIAIRSRIVSKRHGKFVEMNGEYYYNDEGSLNGTLLNGVQIGCGHYVRSQPYHLENGDVIRIAVPDAIDNPENVMMIFSENMALNSRWQYIDISAKPTHELEIGRGVPKGELNINNNRVSRSHAKIVYWTDRVFVVDKDSNSGVIVNGKKITESCFLNDYDVITIANTKIIYAEGKVYFNIEPGGIGMKVNDLSQFPQKNKAQLNGITFTVNPSEMVMITGGSPAERETLFRCINGEETASSGSVFMDGMNLYDNYNILKQRIGNVYENENFYGQFSVYQSLKMRMPKEVQKQEREGRLNDVLEITGLAEYQKVKVKSLDDGQKKSFSIAAQLMADPDILFLNNPSMMLDPERETDIMKQLRCISQDSGKTVVVINPTLLNVHLFDKIIFLAPGGNLCYCGSPTDALAFFDVKFITDVYGKIRENAEYFIGKYRKYIGC